MIYVHSAYQNCIKSLITNGRNEEQEVQRLLMVALLKMFHTNCAHIDSNDKHFFRILYDFIFLCKTPVENGSDIHKMLEYVITVLSFVFVYYLK